MTRLIDADELHEIVNWSHEKPPYSKKKIHRIIDMARTVDAEPVRHGKWTKIPSADIGTCSCCGDKWGSVSVMNYCPNCGARMDVEQEKQND